MANHHPSHPSDANSTTTSKNFNVFIMAADNSPSLVSILQEAPALASSQDEHGYSLLHAAASYNHIELLRKLVTEFNVNVDLKDEDGETALFVVETVECAKVLVEELHAEITIRGSEGKTAREKISQEDDFPQVAVYLRIKELELHVGEEASTGIARDSNSTQPLPPLPEGINIEVGTMDPQDAGELEDPEFRRRIEELAAREDFQGEAGQETLRAIVTEALRGEVGQERDVRQRTS